MVRTSDGDSALTDAEGRYALQVANGWAGTLTPAKANHVFDPPWRTLSVLHDDVSDMDFRVNASAQVTLSGRCFLSRARAKPVWSFIAVRPTRSTPIGTDPTALPWPNGWSGRVHPTQRRGWRLRLCVAIRC